MHSWHVREDRGNRCVNILIDLYVQYSKNIQVLCSVVTDFNQPSQKLKGSFLFKYV